MIKVENINKQYAGKLVASNINVAFEKGKVTSIIGPNGAGKSTLLSIMSRLLNKDSGNVYVDGTELEKWATNTLAKRLAVLKQSNNLNMRFTVKELIAFGRFPHSQGKLTDTDHQVIQHAIEYLDLVAIQDKYLDNLSGGQKQLAFIAMVMAQDTDYVLLDEPLNNLDIKHSLQIMKNIRRLAHEMNKAVVIVIHDINFASCYSDNIIAMKNGEIAIAGNVDQVIQASVLESVYDTPFKVVTLDNQHVCVYY
ncbi:siderophore ABC transporter ATP-binding protein [Psychromonas sp. B3M02]|uniref:iron ABC transporter ATP-binding protein n=1 Tax=Psychromonas sp. B3M02 TaxID=2267226 RepID=UPI000DE8873B|nr:ATP-binding cassette domain-containing protein [Psychromonas sp. B3M02]RBW43430.1 siderophore ABC transporter ATP-binding protein [Psychromonas sp. B3M02]